MKQIIKENKRFKVIRQTEEFIDTVDNSYYIYSRYILKKKTFIGYWRTIIKSIYVDVTDVTNVSKEHNYKKFINLFNVISNIY